ncbi:class I SAM-dependent methyltransferase [Proteiniborus sp. MB09-C3]|uniref:class I SAM-dependent methyltransferase n=1 Tax=Proteiniborus sp. MB09-C3 TaxID=3050072 RepID=UPI002552E7FF|nr:class I SAM-dependent methyltransferase [Proteiniborus sp. MB09-C3]WIV12437.1 class I SAM-dependent methyltransferase [Proteiniborus sp. MB09-C3]
MASNIEQMAEFFNNRAEGYEEHMLGLEDSINYYKTLSKEIIPNHDKIEILDLGCGTGLELEEIFKKCPNANITGIDMSESMLELLKNKYVEFSKQIKLIKGSYLNISFPKNKYDYVISSMTMHHFTYEVKRQLYSNIKDYLKKETGIYIEGDYIVDDEKEKEYLKDYYDKLKQLDKELYHIDIPFSANTQKNLLIEAGFSRVKAIYQKENSAILIAYTA